MREKSKDILIVVAHSDDETLGLGGTIKKHVQKGDNVYAIYMTDGVTARKGNQTQQVILRKNAAIMASKILGFKWETSYRFDDNEMDSYPLLDIIKKIELAKFKINPDIVYTHSVADLNIDHRRVSEAVLVAFRPQPDEKCREIRLFEVVSATDYGHENVTGKFVPNLYIDISGTWEKKEEALTCYNAEMRKYPHSRSIEAIKNLARYRGNQVGLNLCEAFQVIRKIEI